jgi:hypothetical protein
VSKLGQEALLRAGVNSTGTAEEVVFSTSHQEKAYASMGGLRGMDSSMWLKGGNLELMAEEEKQISTEGS